MKSKILLGGAIVLALGLLSLPASSQDGEGAVLAGTWYFETVVPAGLCPSVMVFHSDGTVSASGCIALGGLPATNPYLYTPFQGVWERIGPHEFKATFYSLRFDPSQPRNPVVGVARKIDYFSFTEDFNHFAGTSYMSMLPCPAPPKCPDALSAPESAWQPFNPPPAPSEFPIYADRITSDRH